MTCTSYPTWTPCVERLCACKPSSPSLRHSSIRCSALADCLISYHSQISISAFRPSRASRSSASPQRRTDEANIHFLGPWLTPSYPCLDLRKVATEGRCSKCMFPRARSSSSVTSRATQTPRYGVPTRASGSPDVGSSRSRRQWKMHLCRACTRICQSEPLHLHACWRIKC